MGTMFSTNYPIEILETLLSYELMQKYKQEGLSDVTIGKMINVPEKYVRQLKHHYNIVVCRKQNFVDKKVIQDLFEQGLSDTEIGSRLGYSSRTIEKLRSKFSLTRQVSKEDQKLFGNQQPVKLEWGEAVIMWERKTGKKFWYEDVCTKKVKHVDHFSVVGSSMATCHEW